jgi:hypothetical protein
MWILVSVCGRFVGHAPRAAQVIDCLDGSKSDRSAAYWFFTDRRWFPFSFTKQGLRRRRRPLVVKVKSVK